MKFRLTEASSEEKFRRNKLKATNTSINRLKTFNNADELVKNDYILYVEHFSDTGDRTFIYQYKGYVEATGQYQVMRTDNGSFESWNPIEFYGHKLGASNMTYVHHDDFDINLIKKEFPKWIGDK